MATRTVVTDRIVSSARTPASGSGSSTSGNAFGLLLAITQDMGSAGTAREAAVSRTVI